ncbi:MAG TPA: PDZ domain-containing protein [Candidatus Acidoferrum sp.]|nr:PDZ domain-containing protein [Candidatus Acidoferrum sp.]
MTERRRFFVVGSALAAVLCLASFIPVTAKAQDFDFPMLEKSIRDYTVIVDVKIELSLGMQTNEQEVRLLGTIVDDSGLVIFDGSQLLNDRTFPSLNGMSIKTTPTKIEITTMDKKKYTAEYVGVDRFTKLGFARITGVRPGELKAVKFALGQQFKLGSWLAGYLLLPEFVNPPIAADVGMISTLVESPEKFPLTVGFSPLEVGSVLYDEQLVPVGILGPLMDPSSATADAGGMIESFGQSDVPLLGVITGERLQKMIAVPPKKGEVDRAWLGISLQALTKDLADYLHIGAKGGIIINDIVKDSPAEKAGLQIGDIIYEINGQPLDIDMDEKIPVFQRRIAEMAPGTAVEFSVLRPTDHATDTMKIAAKLEPAPMTATEAPVYEDKEFEFTVRDIVFSDYMARNIDVGSLNGVIVSGLKQGGMASVGGLEIGDVIQKIGDTTISSIKDAKLVMEKVTSQKPTEVIFFVWRDNKTMFVNIKTDWNPN